MHRRHRIILIVSCLICAWLGMQLIHEMGHVFGAWTTGGSVARVHLYPLSFSRTDLSNNPRPLIVAWAGPIFGALAPLGIWFVHLKTRNAGVYVTRFCAGFCLLANGLYLGIGSVDRVGDCGDLLSHGATIWQLWLFGLIAAPLGLLLWHRQGTHFGLGKNAQPSDKRVVYGTMAIAILLITVGLVVGGD